MTDWALWLFTRSGAPGVGDERPSSELQYLRDVEIAEVDRIRNALQVAGEMNGQRLIGPFIGSANRVRSVIEHIREQPGVRSMDLDVQLELGMALDEWLVSTNSFRRRTEREVRRCLGVTAGEGAEGRFQELYDNDLDFRLVWVWRNAAQHHINPVSVTRLVGRRDSEVQTRWVFDGERAQSFGFAWPAHVAAHMTPSLDCVALMERVVNSCNDVACQIMVDNEEALDGAADLLWEMFAERQDDKPGGRVLARIATGLEEVEWDWLPIRWDLPTYLMLQLEKSRVHLGLPRKRPDLDIGDGVDLNAGETPAGPSG